MTTPIDTTPEEAIVTVLRVHDGARDLERDEGFPGMFEMDGSGEIAALRALGYELCPVGEERYSGMIAVVKGATEQGLVVHVATRATCAEHIEAGDDQIEAAP